MKRSIPILLFIVLLFSCNEKHKQEEETKKDSQIDVLPYKSIDLSGLDDFEKSGSNWQIVGGVIVDRSKDNSLGTTEGKGVLVNIPSEENKDQLLTDFEHGDMELEIDMMMPRGSNSGLYFQGRYEIQLFDSWQVAEPTYSDMGAIYQRWDPTKEKGKEGYEGYAPNRNAAKAPGLWQHFKIIFHSPKFDASGVKIKNAEFEEVWLNGVLIHENVEVSGPTRSGVSEEDEVAKAPFMIQGDHGPVAFKNFNYKLYDQAKLSFHQMKMKEFDYASIHLPDTDTLTPIRVVGTDTISAAMAIGDKVSRILDYQGKLEVPISGDYLFDFRINEGGGLLIIDNDTLINRDGNFSMDSLGLAKVSLEKGHVPFRMIYNKHNPWAMGFSLYAEGPGIQNKALHASSSLNVQRETPENRIMVEPATDKAATQRSFMMHKSDKRTHVISVGTPEKINYTYDLAYGCLLKVWSGEFLEATQMWHSRGNRQLGEPAGFMVALHGDPEFTVLNTDDSEWPSTLTEEEAQSSEGYELDKKGIPHFIRKVGPKNINDVIEPTASERSLKRTIVLDGEGEIWHKIASGESIEKLPDGSYIVNDESYFVNFSDTSLPPLIRRNNGIEELLIKIPAGNQKVEYSIIW